VYSSLIKPGTMTNQADLLLERWQQAGNLQPYQRYTQTSTSSAGKAAALVTKSSAMLTDASFIRLKNIALQYTLGNTALKRLKLANVQLFVQAQNLATLTKYKGLDPESQSITSLPPLFTVAAGIKLTF